MITLIASMAMAKDLDSGFRHLTFGDKLTTAPFESCRPGTEPVTWTCFEKAGPVDLMVLLQADPVVGLYFYNLVSWGEDPCVKLFEALAETYGAAVRDHEVTESVAYTWAGRETAARYDVSQDLTREEPIMCIFSVIHSERALQVQGKAKQAVKDGL